MNEEEKNNQEEINEKSMDTERIEEDRKIVLGYLDEVNKSTDILLPLPNEVVPEDEISSHKESKVPVVEKKQKERDSDRRFFFWKLEQKKSKSFFGRWFSVDLIIFYFLILLLGIVVFLVALKYRF